MRSVAPNDQPVLVLLNFSGTDSSAEIELPEQFQLFAAQLLSDRLGKERLPDYRREPLLVPLAPWSARVLVPAAG